ncbi:TPR domain-containing protein [Pasteurellaceae bacterium 22721_9_1]
MSFNQDILYWGIALFALISLIVFIPFGRKINWQKNYRQNKNIELYQQQMASQPSADLADELSQRLLDDEQCLQSNQKQIKSAVSFSPFLSLALWGSLIIVPLVYYFSLNRLDYIQQGEQAFKQKQHQLRTASSSEKNDDYILSIQNKLKADPNDSNLWLELGQAYALNSEFDHALIAYGNAEQLSGSKPAILGLAATALYYQAGQKITPKAQTLIDTALQQDGYEIASLSLLASDAFLRNDYANALMLWQKILDSERSEVDRRKTIESMQLAERLLNAKGNP